MCSLLKEQFTQKRNFSHHPLTPDTDGKSGEVLESAKHFWSFTAKQCCSISLNNWSTWGLVLKHSRCNM